MKLTDDDRARKNTAIDMLGTNAEGVKPWQDESRLTRTRRVEDEEEPDHRKDTTC